MPRRYRRRRKRNNGTFILIVLLLIAAVGNGKSAQTLQQVLVALLLLAALVIAAIFFFRMWQRQRELQRLRALEMVDIDVMDGLEFEKFVAKVMASRGFTKVRLTERYDYGVDIIAHKDGVRWGVQVKHYSRMVKVEAVRQVVTALNKYKCQRAMVVTNSTFSRPAKVLAETNDCVLIGKDELAEWIIAFQKGK